MFRYSIFRPAEVRCESGAEAEREFGAEAKRESPAEVARICSISLAPRAMIPI
jgi:hypothetical protein